MWAALPEGEVKAMVKMTNLETVCLFVLIKLCLCTLFACTFSLFFVFCFFSRVREGRRGDGGGLIVSQSYFIYLFYFSFEILT